MDLKKKRETKKHIPDMYEYIYYVISFSQMVGDTYSLNQKYFPKTNRNCDTHHKTKLNNS